MKPSLERILAVGVAATLAGCAGQINVMTLGVGTGRVQYSQASADCGPTREVCQRSFPKNSSLTLTAVPDAGDRFAEWGGNCSGSAATCTVSMNAFRAVTARFEPSTALPALPAGSLTGSGIQSFLTTGPGAAIAWTPEKFISVLNGISGENFATNWILMPRSESLQTAHARSPRLLMPNGTAQQVFGFSLSADPGWPGSDPNVVEFMEWDAVARVFRFHEINLGTRSVSVNEPKCQACHSGRPNWDAYDSWGGMLPFNRDRVYKGSLDAAAFRYLFRLWNQTGTTRAILEQLALPTDMTRNTGGGFNNGRITFSFDAEPNMLVEPLPADWGATSSVSAGYPAGSPASDVLQGGDRFVIRANPASSADQGRGVDLFDRLSVFNARRIAQELIDHPRTVADVRPIAMAIFEDCDLQSVITPPRFNFFLDASRAGNSVVFQADTEQRRRSLPALKADAQLLNLDGALGLWQSFASTLEGGMTVAAPTTEQLRQQLFRREREGFRLDSVTGLMIDREVYTRGGGNDIRVMELRFFLEPLGVAVDKFSMGVGGRSRTYTFADVFDGKYANVIVPILRADLGLPSAACSTPLMTRVRNEFARIPDISATPLPAPRYAEVQAIFNRNCLQCHGDLTVNGAAPVAPNLLPGSSFAELTSGASPRVIPGNTGASRLWQRLVGAGGAPLMPPAHNGPALSGPHIRVIERWIAAGAPST